MTNPQHEQREAARKAFMDSLNKFEESLESIDEPTASKSQDGRRSQSRNSSPPKKKEGFSLQELEQAAADIDEFLKSSQQQDNRSADEEI